MTGIETIQIHPAIGIALVAIGASPQPRLTAVQYAARDDRQDPGGLASSESDEAMDPAVLYHLVHAVAWTTTAAQAGIYQSFVRLLRMIIKL